jgi:hypothetical protein
MLDPGKGTVLSLYDCTGNMVEPWAEAGYECICVDIQHEPGMVIDGNVMWVGADILTWLPPRRKYIAAFAFPPCTDIAVSGARWFRQKGLRALAHAIDLFGRAVEIIEWTGARGFVENPVSVISSHYRKPDFTFDPCEYGDPWTKKTCLWAYNGFTMPPRTPVEATEGSKMHRMPPSADRANLRSATPPGFARAVYEHLSCA